MSSPKRPAICYLQRADRDWPGAVSGDHCGERAGPAAGVGGDARRAGEGALSMSGNMRSRPCAAPNKTKRCDETRARARRRTPGHGLAILSDDSGHGAAGRDLVYLIYKGASSLNLAFFTQIPKPEGEEGGGMANAIVGSGVCWAGQPDGHSDRHRRRHLSGGVWPRNALANAFALPPMCSTACLRS
jgi:hypothetical protein